MRVKSKNMEDQTKKITKKEEKLIASVQAKITSKPIEAELRDIILKQG